METAFINSIKFRKLTKFKNAKKIQIPETLWLNFLAFVESFPQNDFRILFIIAKQPFRFWLRADNKPVTMPFRSPLFWNDFGHFHYIKKPLNNLKFENYGREQTVIGYLKRPY